MQDEINLSRECDKMSKEDKNLIAYCGLYCGDYPIHRGKIADLARDLRKISSSGMNDVLNILYEEKME